MNAAAAPTAPVGSNNVFAGLVRPVPQQAANDAPPEPETPALSISRDRRLAAAVIGPRLRTARELGGVTQVELAERLGHRNTTQTSLWEAGQRPVTLHALIQSSVILGVSLDFLCGLCDDPTRDPAAARRRACLGSVRAQIERLSEEIIGNFEIADRLTGPDASHFRVLVKAADAMVEAVQTLQRLNAGQFDGLRGGAPLVRAVEEAQQAVLTGRAALHVHDECHAALMRRLSAIGRQDAVDEV